MTSTRPDPYDLVDRLRVARLYLRRHQRTRGLDATVRIASEPWAVLLADAEAAIADLRERLHEREAA